MKQITAIVLAAGKGTRINAKDTNKVLIPIANKPIVGYITELLTKLKISPIISVVGYKKQPVIKYLQESVTFVTQKHLLGTGHAVKVSLCSIPKSKKHALVFYGDHSFFYTKKMILNILKTHLKKNAAMTLITVDKKDPTDYGRILRDSQGKIICIREHKDASAKEKKIKEINAGAYCFKVSFLKKYLPQVKKNPLKHEYYLTDLVEIGIKDGQLVEAVKLADEAIAVGVNTQEELTFANRLMRKKRKKC